MSDHGDQFEIQCLAKGLFDMWTRGAEIKLLSQLSWVNEALGLQCQCREQCVQCVVSRKEGCGGQGGGWVCLYSVTDQQ